MAGYTQFFFIKKKATAFCRHFYLFLILFYSGLVQPLTWSRYLLESRTALIINIFKTLLKEPGIFGQPKLETPPSFLLGVKIKLPCVKQGSFGLLKGINYSFTAITAPEPTVLPPSRIAKRRPTSIAIGVISSTSISTLSPGIHISTPSGREIVPVTSVVLK